MARKTVELADFAKELKVESENQIKRFKAAMVRGVVRSYPQIVENSPVDTGLYAQSWDFTPTEEGVILGNYAPHASIIEYGARPFKPPLGPLLAWAKRVLKDGSQPPDYSDDVWALAIGTQKKIMEVGIKPRAVMQNLLPIILDNIKKEYLRNG